MPILFADDPTFLKTCLEHLSTILPAGSKILDLGCGAGIESRALEQRGFTVYPLDTNYSFLRTIKQKFPPNLKSLLLRAVMVLLLRVRLISELLEHYFPKLESRQRRILADALNIPIGEDSIDGCLIKHFLTFGTDRERLIILKEVRRVLKPGGVIAIYNESRKISYDIKPNSTDVNGHYPIYNPDEHIFSRYAIYALDEAGLKTLLETAGFVDINIESVVTTTDRFGTTAQHMVAFARKPQTGRCE